MSRLYDPEEQRHNFRSAKQAAEGPRAKKGTAKKASASPGEGPEQHVDDAELTRGKVRLAGSLIAGYHKVRAGREGDQ